MRNTQSIPWLYSWHLETFLYLCELCTLVNFQDQVKYKLMTLLFLLLNSIFILYESIIVANLTSIMKLIV